MIKLQGFTRPSIIIMLGLFLTVAGCGGPVADYSKVDLVNAYGTVLLDGQPLSGAVVTFEDPTDDTFSYAMTDSAGRFTLQFDSEMKGVKTGKKIVRISTTRKLLGLNVMPGQEDGEEGSPNPVEQVPQKYNESSELTVEVTKGQRQYDFDLQSS